MEEKKIDFVIPKKEREPAGQLYLGTFLAFALFFSFFFGNLLFFLIVLIISIFIFLEKDVEVVDSNGNVYVEFNQIGVVYAKKEYSYKEILSFTVHDQLFGENAYILRIVFKSPGKPDLFIPTENKMQTEKIYDIIKAHVRENKQLELSFVDSLVLRFF